MFRTLKIDSIFFSKASHTLNLFFCRYKRIPRQTSNSLPPSLTSLSYPLFCPFTFAAQSRIASMSFKLVSPRLRLSPTTSFPCVGHSGWSGPSSSRPPSRWTVPGPLLPGRSVACSLPGLRPDGLSQGLYCQVGV